MTFQENTYIWCRNRFLVISLLEPAVREASLWLLLSWQLVVGLALGKGRCSGLGLRVHLVEFAISTCTIEGSVRLLLLVLRSSCGASLLLRFICSIISTH